MVSCVPHSAIVPETNRRRKPKEIASKVVNKIDVSEVEVIYGLTASLPLRKVVFWWKRKDYFQSYLFGYLLFSN